ncbi:MAG TPA: HAD family hydrolase [Candidatus Lambdaproteobacteria bacterium]|nr:HAD hydrolase-like protein [SAR324 cluster bacterium]HBL56739.1 haloacid dehalogenase [Deltaproteobacteria bacterium]HHZ78836.1 HAD family hydrolase [Candidatus Lambdaproteobacteria bacterium]HIA56807.1 HAD family hydrolase [Candidatus Lambdaproteobacteria bacterium]HIB45491.1 HAD family hydrolase [Candidatus Lambdaproteobacteria bacterium]
MFDVIAFDADDTLWHNESIFTMTQIKFREMLSSHGPEVVDQTLFSTQIKNLEHFGYGIKGFVLSMIETAIELTDGAVSGHEIQQVLEFGREMLAAPIELLPHSREVVEELSQNYSLLLITKGDLIDQETKIARSGLADYFDGVEIVSDKTAGTYSKILTRHKIDASRFMMIGNSMRSDIVPIVQIGAHAVHVPYLSTWEHEQDHPPVDPEHYTELEHLGLLPQLIRKTK